MSEPDLEQRCIDVVRGFAMDGPQKANSGHPGTAMALAPLAYTLWTRIMRYDPTAPSTRADSTAASSRPPTVAEPFARADAHAARDRRSRTANDGREGRRTAPD